MPRATGLARVAVVEDHVLFAEALAVALELEGHDVVRVPVPDAGSTSGALLGAVLKARPGVALVDLDLGPQISGLRFVGPLTRAGIAVVVVTGSNDLARWGECLRYGARAVLPKSGSLASILAALRHIQEGRAVLTREDRERLLAHFHDEKQVLQQLRSRLATLTPREAVVLGQLMAGHQVCDIARASVVSEATVRTQVKSILAKLRVSSQVAAVGAAHAAHWQPPTGQRPAQLPQFGHVGRSIPS